MPYVYQCVINLVVSLPSDYNVGLLLVPYSSQFTVHIHTAI